MTSPELDAPAAPITQWSAGSFGTRQREPQILFGQMHEDPEIEAAAFRGHRRVFAIASAGCTALHLAPNHEVIACDINPIQLSYAEARAHGGPMRLGTAERAMNFARSLAVVAGWRPPILRDFLALSDPRQQATFWSKHLDTHRFRLGIDTLLSRPILRLMYAPRFLSFLPPHFGAVVRNRLASGFATHPNATNPYARALLLGEFHDPPIAPTTRLRFVRGDAAAYLESCPPASFDGFTLSNILDGADPSFRVRLAQAVRRAASPDAVAVLRSFGEPRPSLALNQASRDRSLLWGVVDVRPAASF